jgi:hypothetical protein
MRAQVREGKGVDGFETAVGLFLFNRPETTARVVDVLRRVRPRRLFAVADGPRPGHPGDPPRCAAARAVLDAVDWDCTLRTDFSPVNLGCGRRVASGISWIFDQVEEAILLEDDCVPDPTFFPYCAELLARYRDDERVLMVTGTNPLAPWRTDAQSYHFALHGYCWGWATWRRAWRLFDFAMSALDLPETPARLLQATSDEAFTDMVLRMCRASRGRIDIWDWPWALAQLLEGRLAAVSAVNLVSNIGFSTGATHTHQPLSLVAGLRTDPLAFPLRHPPDVAADREYDRKSTAWRLGRPDLDVVLGVVNQRLEAGRHAPALLLVEAALRTPAGGAPDGRALLLAARARALAGMRRPPAPQRRGNP